MYCVVWLCCVVVFLCIVCVHTMPIITMLYAVLTSVYGDRTHAAHMPHPCVQTHTLHCTLHTPHHHSKNTPCVPTPHHHHNSKYTHTMCICIVFTCIQGHTYEYPTIHQHNSKYPPSHHLPYSNKSHQQCQHQRHYRLIHRE